MLEPRVADETDDMTLNWSTEFLWLEDVSPRGFGLEVQREPFAGPGISPEL
jgi:hypothetical protein